MKIMRVLMVLAVVLYNPAAWALSCAMPSVEEMAEQSAAVVLGTVTTTDFVKSDNPHSLSRGVQKVTIRVDRLKSETFFVPKEGLLNFDAHVNAFDAPFFQEEGRYIVFLEEDEGVLTYPVCGVHYDANAAATKEMEVLKALGWD